MSDHLLSTIDGMRGATAFIDRPRSGMRTQHFAWGIMLVALALTVLEGAARKWLIGSAFDSTSYLAYFSKDVAFGLLLLMPRRGGGEFHGEVFRRWLVPGCFLLITGAAGSSLESVDLGGSILTLRAVLLLPLLACFIMPRLRGMPLPWIVWTIGALTLINFVLGVYQNQLPASHVLNRYATDVMDIATSPSGVRATGTFSYITGMAVFSLVGVWCGMVGLSLARDIRQQIFGAATLVGGVACGLASVSRGPVLMAALMLVAWLTFSEFWASKKARALAGALLLLGGAAVFDLTSTIFDLGQGLRLRVESANDSVSDRALGQFDDALEAIGLAPFGSGLGTEQIGRSAFTMGMLANVTFESQLPRIVLELGVLGLIGFIVVSIGAVAALQASKRRCADGGEKAALLATQLFLIASFFSNIVFNHVASAFAWLIFTAVMAAFPAERR